MGALVDGPIDVGPVIAAVADPGFGATLLFLGVTRDSFEGRGVTRLEYEAWPELALRELTRIEAEIAERWPGARVAVVHRLGVVPIGEVSVAIATGAAHRDACYAANRYAIEQLKARVPIWKKEIYVDGSTWKANAPGPARG
ncbi:MAG TPA: molybdenum cofactor biosynthesis protein MoaE [Myxococcota bacterium]|nr:molybdenum cofactor biosynthesis protein MoaE [Myxococcota bacterium]